MDEENKEQNVSAEEETVAEQVVPPEAASVVEVPNSATGQEMYIGEQGKKKKTPKKLMIVLGCVAALIALLCLAYFGGSKVDVEQAIVGTWLSKDQSQEEAKAVFKSDGTGKYKQANGKTIHTFSWKVEENQIVISSFESSYSAEKGITLSVNMDKYTISQRGGKLVLRGVENKRVWVKEPEEKGSSKKAYEISEDLVVLCDYIKDGHSGFGQYAFSFVKNDSEDTIIDYSIAHMGFDVNGNVTQLVNTTNKYHEQEISMANILPDMVYGLSEGSTEGVYLGNEGKVRYIKSVITSVTFKSGEIWELGDLDAWAEDTIANFSVETEKQYTETLKEDAQKALTNPYVSIEDYAIVPSSNMFLKDKCHTIGINIKNIGDKPIRTVHYIVAEFDSQGKGVQMENQSWTFNYQYITCNSKSLTFDLSKNPLEPGKDNYGFWEDMMVGECDDVLIIVENIEFEDETVWQNDCALQFMVYAESTKPDFEK